MAVKPVIPDNWNLAKTKPRGKVDTTRRGLPSVSSLLTATPSARRPVPVVPANYHGPVIEVSSTEPASLYNLLSEAFSTPPLSIPVLSNTHPEDFGVDISWTTKFAKVTGIQRKEITDLIASIRDGRLAKELAQMKQVTSPLLVIEGRVLWNATGEMTNFRHGRPFTKKEYRGLLYAIQDTGVAVAFSESILETADCVFHRWNWLEKGSIGLSRLKEVEASTWGTKTNRDWGVFLLQSFPGIGIKTAEAIWDHFDGNVLNWVVTRKQLAMVPGVGVKTATKLILALNPGLNGDVSAIHATREG